MPNAAHWTALLSAHRSASSPHGEPRLDASNPFRSPFETDHDRIVYSAPFRRLARKTQVHPLAPNDQVHNRLTHSIEVASVGRSLARRLGAFLIERNELPKHRTADDVVWAVQAACLAHDLGNPPFGHAGEYAVREWVSSHPDRLFHDVPQDHPLHVPDDLKRDWQHFEGNAQGFRLGARTDLHGTYLRLTDATLGALVKYPWTADDSRADSGKFNVYASERELFHAAWKRMELQPSARHPLSFLTEAADDICYRLIDMEDGVEVGLLDQSRVRDCFNALLDQPKNDAPLGQLRAAAIGRLIEECWIVFKNDYPAIRAGTRSDDLKSSLTGPTASALAELKKLYQDLFADRNKTATELGAYKSLGRIVYALGRACSRLVEDGKYNPESYVAKRTLDLAWGRDFAVAHQHETYAWWLRQIMDYVSGLTDNYTRQLSREIEGG
ncbi:MAG: dNTP triphosphohydrolase [Algisphaera sp.]